jgi:hypothetical protein
MTTDWSEGFVKGTDDAQLVSLPIGASSLRSVKLQMQEVVVGQGLRGE